MPILSTPVLSDTGSNWNGLSDPIKAAGWYGRTNGLHTISFTLRDFVGRIYVVATLENSPEDADANNSWFPIQLAGTSCPWIEFPVKADQDKPAENTSLYGFQTTGTFVDTFMGNFTYIKVGYDRDYLGKTPEDFEDVDSSGDTASGAFNIPELIAVGRIEQVLINY